MAEHTSIVRVVANDDCVALMLDRRYQLERLRCERLRMPVRCEEGRDHRGGDPMLAELLQR